MSSIETDHETARTGGVAIEDVGEYIDAISEMLEFPLNNETDPIRLFVIGMALNAVLSPAAPDGLILLMIIPLCILLGYLGSVGEHVGKGNERPPNFEIEDIRDYFFTGVAAFAFVFVLFMLVTVLLVPAVILAMLITMVGIPMSDIRTALVYLFTGGLFILLVYLLPALPIWSRNLRVREVFHRGNIETLFERTFRKEYFLAFLVFLPLAITMNLAIAVGPVLPVVGFLVGAAFSFYFQLAWMKAAGLGYFA